MLFHQPFNSKDNYNYNIRFHSNTAFDYHFHKNLELVYVVKGSLDCTINNKNDILNEGDFALCLSYEIHKYTPRGDTEYWVLVFSEDFVKMFANQTRGKVGEHFKFRCEDDVENYIKVRLIYNNDLTVYGLKAALYAVCEQYLSNIKLIDKDIGCNSLVLQITDYIQTNYQKNISLSDLAKALGYDYHYLSRYFNGIFNMSFTDFINLYRMQHATELLNETNKSVTEIALESGFQSTRSFNHFFKKSTGTTPSAYKKINMHPKS